jgi:hypothetical protein
MTFTVIVVVGNCFDPDLFTARILAETNDEIGLILISEFQKLILVKAYSKYVLNETGNFGKLLDYLLRNIASVMAKRGETVE